MGFLILSMAVQFIISGVSAALSALAANLKLAA
jgi:small neutral amino acid transporter SnatA (MarC family)